MFIHLVFLWNLSHFHKLGCLNFALEVVNIFFEAQYLQAYFVELKLNLNVPSHLHSIRLLRIPGKC